ncbi:DOK1 protein, partial [Polyodon spathula]|nr:DOK1 protein [Polyodon spathula]
QVMFSFEAGRRCDSGPGNFTFETKQGNEIFQIVEAAIKEQKVQAEENRQSYPSLDSESLASQQIRSAIAELPRTSSLLKDQANLYSEPMDSVRPPKPSVESLYSDPVDSIKPPAPAPRQRHGADEPGKPEPLYSDIYDRVTYDLAQKASGLMFVGGDRNGGADPEEHIYDEPEGRAWQPPPAVSSLYDEARLGASAWRKQGVDDQTGHEIPYNPSTDNCCVPPYEKQQQPKPKAPKPAPKPQISRKEPPPLPLGKANFNNSNNKDIYSMVMKGNNKNLPLRNRGQEDLLHAGATSSPESVYEDLGSL